MKFAGRIVCIDRKTDDTNNEEDVLIECTELTSAGEVEIAWTDRNERSYVRFKLADLVTAMCLDQIKSNA